MFWTLGLQAARTFSYELRSLLANQKLDMDPVWLFLYIGGPVLDALPIRALRFGAYIAAPDYFQTPE